MERIGFERRKKEIEVGNIKLEFEELTMKEMLEAIERMSKEESDVMKGYRFTIESMILSLKKINGQEISTEEKRKFFEEMSASLFQEISMQISEFLTPTPLVEEKKR